MNDFFDEGIFEGMLKAAFTNYYLNEAECYPSDDELAKMYPIPKRLVRKLKRKQKEVKYRQPLYMVYIKRTAVIVLTVISVLFSALMTNISVRATVKDTIVEWFDTFIRFDFTSSNRDNENEFEAKRVDDLKIGYVPEGFSCVEDTKEEGSVTLCYMNDSGEYVVINIINSADNYISVDIENHGYEKTIINNHEGYFTYNENTKDGSIVWGNENVTINISGVILKDELIKIAESIN